MKGDKTRSAAIASMVEETVSKLRGKVLARLREQDQAPDERRPGLDLAELQRELAMLEDRLLRCRRNLAASPRNQDAKQTFIGKCEKRRDALRTAIRRLEGTDGVNGNDGSDGKDGGG